MTLNKHALIERFLMIESLHKENSSIFSEALWNECKRDLLKNNISDEDVQNHVLKVEMV